MRAVGHASKKIEEKKQVFVDREVERGGGRVGGSGWGYRKKPFLLGRVTETDGVFSAEVRGEKDSMVERGKETVGHSWTEEFIFFWRKGAQTGLRGVFRKVGRGGVLEGERGRL